MIKKQDGITLEFGTGDICVASGYLANNANVSTVVFKNQKPREIGSEGILKSGEEYEIDELDVMMTFSKSESIDVIIKALQQAKEHLDGE